MQRFKSIYFADHPATDGKRRNVKVAFGAADEDLFQAVRPLSSQEVRDLLGQSYLELKARAEDEGLSLNAHCVNLLRQASVDAECRQPALIPEPEPLVDLQVDPIQATFRGGGCEPLHDWYPYLEGYSPAFVTSLLEAFAPSAARLLDPFGGTGTTPLTAAMDGRLGFYCELNPLLQFLVETKASILAASKPRCLKIAAKLEQLASDLPSAFRRCEPDQRLAASYNATFGESEFFDAEQFDAVLRLRSWLDALACSDPLCADVAAVAVVASLIPASNLIRRGDLRFRRESERGTICQDLTGAVARKLQDMVDDIKQVSTVEQRPLLIAGDAKRLDRVSPLDVDAIVTSPPYLNGTNYYRNTKVELWFLRGLLTSRDLAAFRNQTVTAGINDVTVGKETLESLPRTQGLVDQLHEAAYDRRIPSMVESYFSDMTLVFRGLRRHLKPGGPLLIDIGDSAYAGVHVDTPSILSDILAEDGWDVREETVLRQRLSRSGQPLRQVLLAAMAPARTKQKSSRSPAWTKEWGRFKEQLPHQGGDFAKRNWGHPLHSLCSYQGKMKPSLAHHLVKAFTKPGDRLLDPFGGVGTIPFEAAQQGVTAWSFDISPAATPIAAAKLRPADRTRCDELLDDLAAFIRSRRPKAAELADAMTVRFNGPLIDYFHPDTFKEVILARRFFRERPPTDPAGALVFSCLLHVLHGNRPYALSRRSHPITPFSPTGEAEPKVVVEKVREKLERATAAELPDHFAAGTAMFQDATSLWPREVDELDAVITSPPFFDSTRFYLANWMRLWFAGWSAFDFKDRPLAFVDERQKQDFSVYEPILRQARERLKPGGVCVLHLGKSRKCDMAEEIARVAKPWFCRTEVFAESVEHCESHGIRDKGTVVEHTYLVLS